MTISADFKKVGFFCGLICLMVSFIFIFGYSARAETKYIESTNGQTCAEICEADEGENGEPLYCVGMTVGHEWQDHRFCWINEDAGYGGGDYCEKAVGGCNSVLYDGGFGGCSNPYSDNDCYNQSYRQASWTDCVCRTDETPILNHTGTEDTFENIGANWAGDPFETDYFYQGFNSPTNNIGKITRFSTFIGSLGWNGTSDPTNFAWFKLAFYFADSVNDCFAFEVQKDIRCMFGCQENLTYSQVQVPANPDGTLRAENYWELNGTLENPIYDSAEHDEYFCGIGIFGSHMQNATSSIIVLTQENENLMDGRNVKTSSNVFPLSFKFYGEQQEATSTGECLCDDFPNDPTWYDYVEYGISCALKKTTCWLFIPSDVAIETFVSEGESLKEKFPASTLYGLVEPIKDSADIEMNGTSTSNLKMPMVNKTGDFYMLTVASSSSVSAMIGTTNANSWRVGIAYVIWAMFAGLVFMIIF